MITRLLLFQARHPRFTAVLLLLAFLPVQEIEARVGGGHSYSGGGESSHSSGHSGSGGGSSDGAVIFELVYWLLRLTFRYPRFMLPIWIILGFLVWLHHRQSEAETVVRGGGIDFEARARTQRIQAVNLALDALREKADPDFSRALFVDFSAALYAKAHTARGEGKVRDVSAFFTESALKQLEGLPSKPNRVVGVVIGSATIESVGPVALSEHQISVRFQANYTEETTAYGSQSWYAEESWTFSRKAGVRSPSPTQLRAIACPACGAAPRKTSDGRCTSCSKRVDQGDFSWVVTQINGSRSKRPPLLTSNVPEQGTHLPTLVDPSYARELQELQRRYSDFTLPLFEARVRLAFTELQRAWSNRNWELARPYESDQMFQTHYYWIAEYLRQKLKNVLDRVTIQRITPVKIRHDRWLSSFTVRIHASALDCTRTDNGAVVSGHATRPRVFTEYWTFIRGSTARPVKKQGQRACPACGAELKINMAGHCEFCDSKVTTGDFDWVLSQIEQDESYTG